MHLSEFKIGEEFYLSEKKYRCTDIGTRVVTAIRLDPTRKVTSIVTAGGRKVKQHSVAKTNDSWFSGPPYMIEEVVIDENDMSGCTIVE